MPNPLQTFSFFVDGETHNQKESMTFWPFASVEGCIWIVMLAHNNSHRGFGQT